ncbi:MAG: glycosyltransferase family 2 protein [Bdellovibrionales bacterium]|nr:glycosyltransferase family 2 protein [Bdellovibrionales bacterium]
MPEADYRLTINIVTHGRLELFKRCLESCMRSLPKEAEILVLVNGGDSATVDYLSSIEYAALRWEALSQTSLARCRNYALQVARGSVLYCLDDDVEVPPRLFSRALDLFERDPELCVLGGPNLTPPMSTLKQRLFGAVMTSWFAAPRVRRRYGALAARGKSAGEFDLMFCNLAIAIARIPKWLRFEEALRSNEENAFVNACNRANLKAGFEDSLFVYHHRRSHLGSFLRQIASYGFGRFQQLTLNWQVSSGIFLVPSLIYPLVLGGLYFGQGALLAVLLFLHQTLSLAAVLDGGSEIRGLGWRAIWVVPLTGCVHLAYGYGFWTALFQRLFFHQKSAGVQPPVVQSREGFETS